MYSELYVNPPNQLSLIEFVESIKDVLNIKTFEKRHSSSYVGEVYYQSKLLGIEIIIAKADDERIENHKYWMIFNDRISNNKDNSFLEHFSDRIARILVRNDFSIVYLNSPYSNAKIFKYIKKKNQNNQKEDIIIREIT